MPTVGRAAQQRPRPAAAPAGPLRGHRGGAARPAAGGRPGRRLLFGNLALELSTQAEEIRSRLQEIFEAQIDLIEAVVVEAKDLGQAGPSVDTREAARSMVAQIEGRALLAKLLNDPAQLETLWRNSLDLLQVPPVVRASVD
ncbi:TetR family transcriptional regulator C-terminal domain-containing protein [Micromonospora sp. NPDC048909]|uniref:TetR family transcriptional regulator C-terminal domain-containing protein n=1 Tax=Micromonospora sp. NPDC048909 TaxID=3155643 RepID=UPI0033E6B1D9